MNNARGYMIVRKINHTRQYRTGDNQWSSNKEDAFIIGSLADAKTIADDLYAKSSTYKIMVESER